MTTTPYTSFCDYRALRAHFTSSYNYQKYEGKIKVCSVEEFKLRRDAFLFQKLAKHSDHKNLIIANFLVKDSLWIGDIISEEGNNNYLEWKKRIEALTYNFKNNLSELNPSFNKNFIVKKGTHPVLIKLFLAKKITPETFVILVDLSRCFSNWDKQIDKDDILWKEVSRVYTKYKPFVTYDKAKFKTILLQHFA